MLWLCRCWVCVLDKLLSDILGYVNIHVPLCIIPIEGDATVEVPFPIFNDVEGFCLEGSKEMFEIVLTNVFDAKVTKQGLRYVSIAQAYVGLQSIRGKQGIS